MGGAIDEKGPTYPSSHPLAEDGEDPFITLDTGRIDDNSLRGHVQTPRPFVRRRISLDDITRLAVVLPFVAMWIALGFILTRPPWVLALLCWTIVTFGCYLPAHIGGQLKFGGGIVESYDFQNTLLDIPCMLLATLTLMVGLSRGLTSFRQRSKAVALSSIFFAFNLALVLAKCFVLEAWIKKASATGVALPERFHANAELLLVLSALSPIVVACSILRCWVPRYFDQLEALEKELLDKEVVAKHQLHYEQKIIAGLGTIRVPYSPILDGVERFGGEKSGTAAPVLVLVHGFGAGNGFWLANLAYLARHFEVYAVEWLGVGRSHRPPFKASSFDEAIDFFVDPLEHWRKAMGLEQFILLGHSMGAIYSTYYALRHRERVLHLILASPAGMGAGPEINALARNDLAGRLVTAVWGLAIGPMALVRWAGPLGPWLLGTIAKRRMEWMPKSSYLRSGEVDLDLLIAYAYQSWVHEPSAELCLPLILAPGAYARRPLDRVILLPGALSSPLSVMYGGGPDWMTKEHGHAVVETLRKEGKPADFLLVPYACHQVFLDSPQLFSAMVVKTTRRLGTLKL